MNQIHLRLEGPRPEESLKYACMTEGFSLKPTNGRSRRDLFCARCRGIYCVFGGLVAERKKGIRLETRYPGKPWYVSLGAEGKHTRKERRNDGREIQKLAL